MTDPITLDATGTFSRVDGTRDVRGLLLPYDEESRLSVSGAAPIKFARGTVAIPRDPSIVTLHVEHDQFAPLGRATALEDTEAGIVATFRIADTDEGDAYLAAPEKRKLSAELRDIVRRGVDGLAAKLTGGGLVSEGAFASAALFALGEVAEEDELDTASLVERLRAEGYTITEPDPGTETTTDATATEDTEPAAPANPEEDAVGAATATGFAAAQPATADVEQAVVTIDGFFAAIEEAKTSGDHSKLETLQGIQRRAMFALQDVTYETGTRSLGTADVITKKDYIGELWQGNQQERRYIPLFQQAALKALEWRGWKWVVKPAVAAWTGNKSDIPSTKPEVSPTSGKAQRFAGGNDIAREFYDFNDTEAIAAYVKALVESYALVSDVYVLTTIKAAATKLVLSASAPADAAPANVNEAHYKIVRGALAVIAARATPTFAIVAQDVFAELALTPKDKTLEFLTFSVGLESGSLEGFRIVPSPDLAAGEVLVGASRAARVLELPGSPIRVNALDIVKGGIDEAVFGYVGVDVQYAAALQLVTRAAA